jgi:hypothetical protein
MTCVYDMSGGWPRVMSTLLCHFEGVLTTEKSQISPRGRNDII